jgi:hypothetical protein
MDYEMQSARTGGEHVDEVMCCMQGASKEASVMRFRPLSVRLGVGGPCKLKTIASDQRLTTLLLAGSQLRGNVKS